ncbi:lymphoid-restricted membrane protein [Xyrichtys novacula]|uniref:Lymphoid-restricted membrane protein n=1 Tax=Xyrichtys novacula TaxID=13765 RepID=A0AAV1HJF1_XYRNO|nr:lymphoid-restricted membrane protein [Xyrichtys novacula]
MSTEPEAETTNYCPPTMLDSEDSDEESSQEEPPVICWNELSIIERVGLNGTEMSEKDLESTFAQIALAFQCDQYTLKQRLQAEEHARNLAEENIQLELNRGRETLEMLKGLCLDSKRSRILQKLELSLDILGGTVERISNTAEVLGAVHQEARVSRAVELMVAHVENLRRQYDRNVAELEEAKRTIQQQNFCRNSIDLRPSPDPEESETRKKCFLQTSGRRRVSISLIPTQIPQIQEKIKRGLRKQVSHDGYPHPMKSSPNSMSSSPSLEFNYCSTIKDNICTVEDRPQDPDETPPEPPAPQPSPQPPPSPTPEPECLPPKQPARKIQNKSSPLDTLRQRHKNKSALSKKKAEKDKKSVNIYRRLSGSTYSSLSRQRPLIHWLYRCRWALLFTYLFVLLCVITLTYVLFEIL